MPVIDGALPEQQRLLEEILDGLRSTRIESLYLYPYRPMFEDMRDPPPGDHGDAMAIEIDVNDRRAVWEATLLARAFACRSNASGLRKIAWFALPNQGSSLENVTEPLEPLGADEIDGFRATVAESARVSSVERFDVLRPQGHAFALTVRVDEPHAFLRFHSQAFLSSVNGLRQRCDGIYAEVGDGEPEPILIVGYHRRGGFSRGRGDLACCMPMLGLGYPGMPPRPTCPVFG